jgi:uncharacterized protein (TIGR02421 family)
MSNQLLERKQKQKIEEERQDKPYKMRSLSIYRIISNIQRGITFEAESEDGSFYIKVDEYVPYVCTAIHDGHKLRPSLEKNCLLNDDERWYEEDPFTGDFIESLPIQIIGLDSRYEYDLNRPPATCVFETAWGKEVWKKPLTKEEHSISLNKHNGFYSTLEALLKKLERDFGSALVYDIHSYNFKRIDREVPVFNIGCESIDEKFSKEIDKWASDLRKIKMTSLENTVGVNDIFFGRGYLLKFVNDNFDHTLTLATEVKKVYCDEETRESYPSVIEEIKEGIKKAITNTTYYFAKKNTSLQVVKKHTLLSSSLTNSIQEVDHQLYKLCKDIEILNFVNPTNLEGEKRKFFASGGRKNPEFHYQPINFDPKDLKRELYKVRTQDIKDVEIGQMYNDVLEAYVSKANMLETLGTTDFMYHSLSYYGQPSPKDVRDGEFLVYAPSFDGAIGEANVDNQQAVQIFQQYIDGYGFDCKIKVTDKMVADAMVNNAKRMLLLKKGVMMTERDVNLLVHHEIGVHMLTTINATLQPLKIWRLGMPANTKTQEGLAVYGEFLSATMDSWRTKELGLRVICIDKMAKGYDFRETFEYITDHLGVDPDKAFYVVARCYRGGGFTKDQLYLKGFKEVLSHKQNGGSIQNLLIGKTSLQYLPIIDELVSRRLALPPKYKTQIFIEPAEERNPILDYLVKVF